MRFLNLDHQHDVMQHTYPTIFDIIAQEDYDTSGKTEQEIEYRFFIKLTDMSQLDQFPTEHHRQADVKIQKDDTHPYKGCIRVREVDHGKDYLLVYKVDDNKPGCAETQYSITKDFFISQCMLCDTMWEKTRYLIPVKDVPNLTWHLDVHMTRDGQVSPWARLELEVGAPVNQQLPIPVSTERVINGNKEKQSDEEVAIVDGLFSAFKLPNPYLNSSVMP